MRTVVAVVIGMAIAGCSGGEAQSPTAPTPTVVGSGRAEPIALGRGIEGLQAYGRDHPGEFGGLYIDPPGGQHVVILFTANLAQHALAVEAIQPGTTLRQVAHTERELTEVLEGIDFEALAAQGIEMVSAGLDTIGNRVTLDAKSNDPTAELRLEAAHGGLLDVTIFPIPGEWRNAADGDGWRLLVAGESVSEAYVVRAATDADAYAALWDAIGLAGDAPAVDLASEVVVSFGHGIGSSCRELRLDDVRIDEGMVFSVTSDPLEPRACTSDLAGAAVFLVAVDRGAAPGGFTLWLNEYAASRGGDFSAPVEVAFP